MCQFLFKQRSKGADWEAANTAMANAAQVMETVLDTYTTGHAGILVRPSADQDSAQAKAEIERALADLPASEARWDVALDTAETPHPWVIVRDSGLPAVANATRITGNRLVAMGLGPRVLATVYAFTWKDRKVYWVYQPRIKAFTPFAPLSTRKRRSGIIRWSCAWNRPSGGISPRPRTSGSGTPSGECRSSASAGAFLQPPTRPQNQPRVQHGHQNQPLHHGNGVATTTNTTRSGAAPRPARRMIPIRVTSFIAT